MNYSNTLFALLFAALPLSSYLFLDQISVRRAEDFAVKWSAREASGFGDLQQLMNSYEDVIFAAGDLKGIGVLQGGRALYTLGETGVDPTLSATPAGPQTKRIGFLKYATTIMLPGPDRKIVYFVFSDDSAHLDFAWLLLSMGVVVGIVIFARRRIEREKARVVKENTLLTMQSLAHDFRAPFTKLNLLLKVLQQNQHSDSPLLASFRSDLQRVLHQADGMLFDFMNAKGDECEPQPVDIASILETLDLTYFRNLAVDAGIQLSFEFKSNAKALGNTQKSTRVLMNLIDNAIKHAKSRVNVRVQSDENHLSIEVENDGPGIAPSEVSNIFDPFYSARKGGCGLGLFICTNFAKAQQGKIDCHSEGDLTRFTFSLPLLTETEINDTMLTTHVAFVDDEAFYRTLMSDALKKDSIAIDTYTNTDDLLYALQDGRYVPDLILIDRFGPNFDVIENRFAESCRDYGYKGPIVLYSNAVRGHEKFQEIFRAVDKSTMLTGDMIRTIIEEYNHES